MRISHREIEECRRSPVGWARARSAGRGWPRLGYSQALLYSIHKYHRSQSAADARAHLQHLIDRNFTNEGRIEQIVQDLDAYINWHQTSGTIVAETNIRLAYEVGGYLDMGGLVSRLDVTVEGYRAVLLGAARSGWRDELRMPLIEDAIARRSARPLTDVSVAVQDLDGTNLAAESFSPQQVDAARGQFRSLGDIVQPLLAASM